MIPSLFRFDRTSVWCPVASNTLAIGVTMPLQSDDTSSIVTLIDVQSGAIIHELATLDNLAIAQAFTARFSPMDDYIVMPSTDSLSGDRTLNS